MLSSHPPYLCPPSPYSLPIASFSRRTLFNYSLPRSISPFVPLLFPAFCAVRFIHAVRICRPFHLAALCRFYFFLVFCHFSGLRSLTRSLIPALEARLTGPFVSFLASFFALFFRFARSLILTLDRCYRPGSLIISMKHTVMLWRICCENSRSRLVDKP